MQQLKFLELALMFILLKCTYEFFLLNSMCEKIKIAILHCTSKYFWLAQNKPNICWCSDFLINSSDVVYWLKRPFFDQFFICLVFAKTSVQGFYVSSRCTLETLKQTLRFDRKKATILSRQFFLVKILWLFIEIKDTNIWREFDGKFRTFIQFILWKFFRYLLKSK